MSTRWIIQGDGEGFTSFYDKETDSLSVGSMKTHRFATRQEAVNVAARFKHCTVRTYVSQGWNRHRDHSDIQ